VIHGVRITGESALRWIDTDRDLAPGTWIELGGQIAQVVATVEQLGDSLSNVEAAPIAVSGIAFSASSNDSAASRELDRLLELLPSLGSLWESADVSGTLVSVNLKRRTLSVRRSDTSDIVTVPFPHANEGD
jgi:hypothetical protein